MKKFYLIALTLIAVPLALYYLGPLKPLADRYEAASMLVLGIIIGLIPSALMGHIGNRITEQKNKKNYEAKLQQFINELSNEFHAYIYNPPTGNEGSERQRQVAATVKELSLKLFGEPSPPVASIRPENTHYPVTKCKWCHLDHEAESGPKGKCRECGLALDLWIGVQGQP